ncbi:putative Mg(2+) transport ATPase [Shimia sp. SK013]|uniref:MgtC/SapB family protein n=1 Tax=Shimia sp. SK013 TaxID=1389006 RepID=UPI0006B69153|nr:MgtC/SapB family protein [Shimia sp. SK013]KPA22674.1 putative Mg(2+) transport ATPase [Shimia sp. SK013]
MNLWISTDLTNGALNLLLALTCGALIGSERQVRQRMAGLRTNALVALGAASYVVFSSLYPNEVSPTRVAAQVVSGIGFLGAGIIFRQGFTVHGLNTAATLWCSAAVGLMAGAGHPGFAAIATAMVVFVNLGLRPLVTWLKRKTRAGLPLNQEYEVQLTYAPKEEEVVRALAIGALTQMGVLITTIERRERDAEKAVLGILLTIEERSEVQLAQLLAPLMLDGRVSKVAWDASDGG